MLCSDSSDDFSRMEEAYRDLAECYQKESTKEVYEASREYLNGNLGNSSIHLGKAIKEKIISDSFHRRANGEIIKDAQEAIKESRSKK